MKQKTTNMAQNKAILRFDPYDKKKTSKKGRKMAKYRFKTRIDSNDVDKPLKKGKKETKKSLKHALVLMTRKKDDQ